MNTKIETYRGIEIFFNTDNAEFYSSLDDRNKNSKSFVAVRKAIDDYIKDNNTFSPFQIRRSAASYSLNNEILNVVGVRKDGRFVTENAKGIKGQISEYDEKDYILYTPELDKYFAELAYLETLVDDAQKALNEARKKCTAPTLLSIKANYIPQ